MILGYAALAVGLVATAGADCCSTGGVPFGAECRPREEVWETAKSFLVDNMPPVDIANELESFGTPCCHNSLLNATLTAALNAKCDFAYAAAVPMEVWLNYVLPYANLNEPRVNWPARFAELFSKLVQKDGTLQQAVISLNEKTAIWNPPSGPIHFQGDQTPLIMDPFSIMMFGYSSCTGFSIYFVDALRSVGVPARVAGTPAWHGVPANGNHNWVEVWNGDRCREGEHCDDSWVFLEGQQSASCNYGPDSWSPGCWFCNSKQFSNGTKVYAASWSRSLPRIPLAWAPNYHEVPGIDRSDWYQKQCIKELVV